MSMDFLTFFDGFHVTGADRHTHTLVDASEHDSMHRTSLPSRQLNALRTFINEEWDTFAGDHGPTFLWDEHIEDLSNQNDRIVIENAPVAPIEEAHEIMAKPIEWYFNTLASIIPTAQRTDLGVEIPNDDMPTYRDRSRALAGVESVVANAIGSDHWLESMQNLAAALTMTSVFLSNVADRENEGFSFINQLTQQIRIYTNSLSRSADPTTAGTALNILVDAICNENFMLNPVQMVEILASSLSFARWDDTRVLAYDAIDKADAAVERFTGSLQEHETDDAFDTDSRSLSALVGDGHATELRRHYDRLMLFLRHDLLRLGGDEEGADQFLNDHRGMEPFPDVLAAQLIRKERWGELLRFCDMVLADDPNQPLLLFGADVAPYGWDSLREAALESLGKVEDLQSMYRERIVEAYDSDEIYNLGALKAVSAGDWPNQVRRILEDYDDGIDRFTRNKVYEQLLVNERLGDEACRYCQQFPKAQAKLAQTIASVQPDAARSIILGPVGLDGSYHGTLPMKRDVYRRIARSLTKYATVFTVAEAQEIASRLVKRYPTRHQLAQALHAFLD